MPESLTSLQTVQRYRNVVNSHPGLFSLVLRQTWTFYSCVLLVQRNCRFLLSDACSFYIIPDTSRHYSCSLFMTDVNRRLSVVSKHCRRFVLSWHGSSRHARCWRRSKPPIKLISINLLYLSLPSFIWKKQSGLATRSDMKRSGGIYRMGYILLVIFRPLPTGFWSYVNLVC